jgi:hypothetical protein
MYEAARIARRLVQENPGAVVHYTSPVSPVVPQFGIKGVPVIIGPLNGNIHHPPAFRSRESWDDWVRRWFLPAMQLLLSPFCSGKRTADVVLVAGGERTRQSLRIAGCREEQFRDSLTCGIPNRLRDESPVEHRGRNLKFVQNRRLVPHKGTDLVIKAMARTRNSVFRRARGDWERADETAARTLDGRARVARPGPLHRVVRGSQRCEGGRP